MSTPPSGRWSCRSAAAPGRSTTAWTAPGTSNLLRDISCPTATTCVAVGASDPDSAPGTLVEESLIETFGAGTWTFATSPDRAGFDNHLWAVSCSNATQLRRRRAVAERRHRPAAHPDARGRHLGADQPRPVPVGHLQLPVRPVLPDLPQLQGGRRLPEPGRQPVPDRGADQQRTVGVDGHGPLARSRKLYGLTTTERLTPPIPRVDAGTVVVAAPGRRPGLLGRWSRARSAPTTASTSPTGSGGPSVRAAASGSWSPTRPTASTSRPCWSSTRTSSGPSRSSDRRSPSPPTARGGSTSAARRPGTLHWWVDALEADDPAAFDPATRTMMLPGDPVTAYKDPVIFHADGTWHMWVCVHQIGEPDRGGPDAHGLRVEHRRAPLGARRTPRSRRDPTCGTDAARGSRPSCWSRTTWWRTTTVGRPPSRTGRSRPVWRTAASPACCTRPATARSRCRRITAAGCAT